MKCKNAERLMMKYIDGNLTEQESGYLQKHISECEKCREDFEIYKVMDFSGTAVKTPYIEDSIMPEIEAMPVPSRQDILPGIIFAALTVLSSLVGFGIMLVIYKNSIIDFMTGMPQFAIYTRYLNNMADTLQKLFTISASAIMPALPADTIQLMGALAVGMFFIYQAFDMMKKTE